MREISLPWAGRGRCGAKKKSKRTQKSDPYVAMPTGQQETIEDVEKEERIAKLVAAAKEAEHGAWRCVSIVANGEVCGATNDIAIGSCPYCGQPRPAV